MPHDFADAIRRRSSSMRSSVRATSMPPHTVSTPSSSYWRRLSAVRSVISREWSTGKMKFDAWPVEPPGLGSGPLSIRTRSFQPRRARCPTRQLPTIPAPMTTACAFARQGTRCSGLVCHRDHLRVGAGREPDISHACTRRASSAARPSRSRSAASRHRSRRLFEGFGEQDRLGVVLTQPCGAVGRERADHGDDHRLLRHPARPRARLLRLSRLLPVPRRTTARRPCAARRLAAGTRRSWCRPTPTACSRPSTTGP